MKTLYEKIGFGTIGIRPSQVDKKTRQIETDDGCETLLHMTSTEMSLSFTIIHCHKDGKERMRSSPWVLDAKTHGLAVLCESKADGHWCLLGKDNVQLHIMAANDGDLSFFIVNPRSGENVFNVPEFSLVTSGTNSHHLLMMACSLVRQIREDDANSIPNDVRSYYIMLERFYEAIGEHHLFRSVDIS